MSSNEFIDELTAPLKQEEGLINNGTAGTNTTHTVNPPHDWQSDTSDEEHESVASQPQEQTRTCTAVMNLILIAASACLAYSAYHFTSEKEVPLTSSDNNQLLYNIMLGLSAMGILGTIGYQCRQSNSFFQLKNNPASDSNLLNGIQVTHNDSNYIIMAVAQSNSETHNTENQKNSTSYHLGIKVDGTNTDFNTDPQNPIALTLGEEELHAITHIDQVINRLNSNQVNEAVTYNVETLMNELTAQCQTVSPAHSGP